MLAYIGFFIFCMVFITVYAVSRANAYSSKKMNKARKSFLAREAKANAVRRADISKLDYLTIPLDKLPIDACSTEELRMLTDELRTLAGQKILNLSAYTNTDLKLMYGPANLEELSSCDTNFITLICTLDKIGRGLIDEGNEDAAVRFLEYSIGIGSDITSTYVCLGSVYASRGQTAKLDNLITLASRIKSLSGPIILSKLKALHR